jgi:hypothetical protein
VGTPIKLPNYLCTHGVKSVDLSDTIAQMITFNSAAAQSITIRLKPRSTIDYSATPTPIPPYDASAPEKFLIIPVVAGVPQVPADCADEATYYREIADSRADISIQAATNPAKCEGTAAQCGTVSNVPTTAQNCDIVTLNLGSLSNPVDACKNQTQYVILDRPNLVYPAGTTANFLGIEGITAVLAQTTGTDSNSSTRIYMDASTVLHVANTAPAITLPEGGIVTLLDGSKVTMSSPSTIDLPHHKITLTNGGYHVSASGNLLDQYKSGYDLAVNDAIITVVVNRSITIPAGYWVPTRPSPYALLPITK